MAMTKAEKARMEELETALALCWPPYAAPSPMSLEEIQAAPMVRLPRRDTSVRGYGVSKAVVGWFYNAFNGRLSKGWSTGYSHNRESDFGDHPSQGMGQMYRTRAEAAMAMRIEMSRDFARKLAAVDRIIREGSTDD